jgi:hypothetical protein
MFLESAVNLSYRWLKCIPAVLALVSLTGCGAGAPEVQKVVPVSGTISMKGKPLAKVTVSFYGPNAVIPGSAVTDDSGKFSLSTVPGENTVTVIGGDADAPAVMDPASMTAGVKGASTKASVTGGQKSADIPRAYTVATNSPLRHTVSPEGDSNVQLEIK